MPIRIKCKCGKLLNIPDAMAGKAVKCPGCSSTLKVPAAGGKPGSKPAAPAAAKRPATQRPATQRPATQRPATQRPATQRLAPKPAAPSATGELDDLFDEEGFSKQVASVCPACAAEMSADAVLCTKCGYHRTEGVKLEAHQTAGVDIDMGTLALQKAEVDMNTDRAMQAKLAKGAGLPWWGLAIVLFLLGSAMTIGVLVVNASRQVDETVSFDPMGLFLMLAAIGFCVLANGAILVILVHAFKKSTAQGFMCFIPLYILYYVWKNLSETWRPLVMGLVAGGISSGLYAAAISR